MTSRADERCTAWCALEQVRLYGVFVYAEDLECSGAYDDPGVTTYVLTAEHSAPHSVAVRAEGDGTGVYRVSVSESDDTGTGCDTAPVAAAQAANTPATGAPAITGTVRVGETLTAGTSVIADEDGLSNAVYSYQWQADGAEISGATGSAYTLAGADKGKAISVKVSFSDDAGNAEMLTSAATAAVEAKPNSSATGLPSISETAQVGETLTADTSGIADVDGLDNAAFAYQWLADGADISGATDSTYTLGDSDMGKAISVTVSFTDGAGHAETLTSAATDVVEAKPNNPATGAPAIRGTAQVGETLTSDTSGISDADGLANASFSYQWRADGADISGATDATYALADSDEGKTVKVRVSFTDDAGNDETLTSAATDAVEARPNRPATGALVITGAARVGELLTADASGIADDDGLDKTSFSYQWQADGADIPGATNERELYTKLAKIRLPFLLNIAQWSLLQQLFGQLLRRRVQPWQRLRRASYYFRCFPLLHLDIPPGFTTRLKSLQENCLYFLHVRLQAFHVRSQAPNVGLQLVSNPIHIRPQTLLRCSALRGHGFRQLQAVRH